MSAIGLTALVMLAAQTSSADASGVLQKAVAFYGGDDAIAAHRSQVTTMDVKLDDGAKGRRVSWVRCESTGGAGGMAREELTLGGQTYVVATDGKHTWRWSHTGPVAVKSAQLTTSLRVSCLGAILLAAQSAAAAPTVDAQGRLVVAQGKARLLLTVDPQDGRVKHLRIEEPDAPTVDVELTAWSPSQGYPVARRWQVKVAGTTPEQRVVVSVGRNARLDEAMFSPAGPTRPEPRAKQLDDDTIDL